MPANPFKSISSGGGGGKLAVPSIPAATDPNTQVAQQFARGLATLRIFDPSKANKLESLYKQYGPDIPPGQLARYGLTMPGTPDQSLGDQLKRGAGGLLGFVGKQLSRPGQAVLGAINPKQEGDNILEGAQRGFTGKDNQTLAEALGYGGGIESKLPIVGKLGFKVANFVGTAAFDPLSYVTFGTGTVAKQGLREVASVAGREVTEQVAKKGLRSLAPEARQLIEESVMKNLGEDAAGKTLAQLEKGVSRVRVAGMDTGLKRGLPLRKAEILGQAEIGARLRGLGAAEPIQQTLEGLGREGAPETLLSSTRTASSSLTDAASAQAAQAGTQGVETGATKPARFSTLKEALIPRTSVTDPAERSVLNSERAIVQGQAHRQTSELAKGFVAATKGMSRNTEQAILEAIQTLPKVDRQGLLDLAKLHPEWDGPLEALAAGAQRVANPEGLGRARGLGDVFEHLVTQPIRRGMRENLQSRLGQAGLDVNSVGVQKAVDDWAEVAIRLRDPALNPGGKLVSLYRRGAVRTPGFFVRNAMTDYLSAMTETLSHKYGIRGSVSAAKEAWAMTRMATKESESEWAKELGETGARELVDAIENNVLGSDVFQDVSKGAVSSKRRALSPLRAFDPIAAAGARVSEHARMTLYLAERKSGLSPKAAADVVKKTLGDYSDYTVFEKKILRDHVIPFYRFHRFNTPFQLAKLVTSPRVAAAELTAQRTFANAENPLPGALPARLVKSPVVALGGGKFLQPSTGLDAAIQAAEPFTQVAASAPGLRNLPGAESLQAEEGLTGRGALQFIGGPTTAGWVKALGEWTTSEDFFTGAPLSERQKWQKIIRDMLPEFGRAMRFSRASEEDLPNILLSVLGGVSTIDVTDAQMRGEVYRRLDILKKLLNDAEVDGQSAGLLEQLGVTKTERGTLPTLSDLRESGQVPELPKLTTSSQGETRNPFK